MSVSQIPDENAGVLSGRLQRTGIVLALGVFCVFVFLPPFHFFQGAAAAFAAGQQGTLPVDELARSMQATVGVGLLMIVLWLTEGVPLPVTGLLPLVLFPLLHLTGLVRGAPVPFSLGAVASSYAHPVIYLFLGSFLLAAALQKWGIDRRLTLWTLTRKGVSSGAPAILLGVMSVTAFLSMWISNTATTAMMLPLGLGILGALGCTPGRSKFGTALMLGIAWSASIGGIGTIIGTPPNGIAIGILKAASVNDPSIRPISFLDWMSFAVPLVVIYLPLAWLLILRVFPPEIAVGTEVRSSLKAQYRELGRMSSGGWRAISVFGAAALLWVILPFRDAFLPERIATHLEWFDEYAVGICAGVSLFFLPSGKKGGRVLEWEDAGKVDWGTLLLFGGGIALSEAMFKTGVAHWLSNSFISGLGSTSPALLLAVTAGVSVLLTEVASNTAVATMLIPVAISVARSAGINPALLVAGSAIGASLAFMLPVSTPPNAMVYGTGYVRIREMLKGGIALDIVGWILVIVILLLFHSVL